jgi:hypothetical protein
MNSARGEPVRLIPVAPTGLPSALPEVQVFDQKEPRMKSHSVLAILLACAAIAPAQAHAKDSDPQSTGPAPVPTPIVYHNTQYEFCFLLPADWKGYTIVADKWSGTVLDTGQKESGPQLLIRNPKWTKDDPWQDIPIMIFTPSQWKLVAAENMAVSAAPIGPAELGQNKNYVFALPPRWIGFTDAQGQEEVQALMNQNPLQAPCGHTSKQPATNLP